MQARRACVWCTSTGSRSWCRAPPPDGSRTTRRATRNEEYLFNIAVRLQQNHELAVASRMGFEFPVHLIPNIIEMLRNAERVTKIEFWDTPLKPEDYASIVSASPPSVEEFIFMVRGTDTRHLASFVSAMRVKRFQNLKYILFVVEKATSTDLGALASLPVKHLHVSLSRAFQPVHITALAGAITKNKTLEDLSFYSRGDLPENWSLLAKAYLRAPPQFAGNNFLLHLPLTHDPRRTRMVVLATLAMLEAREGPVARFFRRDGDRAVWIEVLRFLNIEFEF